MTIQLDLKIQQRILNRFAGNFGSLLKVKLGRNIQPTILNDLISFKHVGSLQSNNEWHLQVDSLTGVHDTLGNCGTIDDSAKNVHKNTLYLQNRTEDFNGKYIFFEDMIFFHLRV